MNYSQKTKNILGGLMTLIFCITFSTVFAQNKPSPAKSLEAKADGLTIKMDYSSPAVKERKIWGGLEPYDKVWRAGANNATTFEVDKAVKINGKDLPAGKYSFFIIPKKSGDWTIIFNTVAEQWGAYKYEESKDALRVDVKTEKLGETQERLEYHFDEKSKEVAMVWDKVKVPFKVTL
ncbi:MAG: DUF2911 domain-containing protein [Flammeovirgaceae bacterium]|nr:DUF2911 domain-containing protein [Flammeovirgaceae bacterium]